MHDLVRAKSKLEHCFGLPLQAGCNNLVLSSWYCLSAYVVMPGINRIRRSLPQASTIDLTSTDEQWQPVGEAT